MDCLQNAIFEISHPRGLTQLAGKARLKFRLGGDAAWGRDMEPTILVVDDDSHVHAIVGAFLRKGGYGTLFAKTEPEAIRQLEQESDRISLVISDIRMPDDTGHLDPRAGFRVLRQVRERWPQIPTIIMSGYDTAETVQEAAQKGASTFIAKPFTPDELIETIRQVMNSQG